MRCPNSTISKISTGIVSRGQYRVRNSATAFLMSSIVINGALNSLGSIISGLTLPYLFRQFGHFLHRRFLAPQCPEEYREHSHNFMISQQVFWNDPPICCCKIEKGIPVIASRFDAESFCIPFEYISILRRRHRTAFEAADIRRISRRLNAKFSKRYSLCFPKAFEEIPKGFIITSHIQTPPS